MAENNLNPEKNKETPEAALAREAFIFEKEKKQIEANLTRQQLLEDQSIREGFRFLFKSIVQFIVFVALGVFLVLMSRDVRKTDSTVGTVLMVIGAGLILRGMMSLGGFRSK